MADGKDDTATASRRRDGGTAYVYLETASTHTARTSSAVKRPVDIRRLDENDMAGSITHTFLA